MTDNVETELIGLTLPKVWIEAIDSKVTLLKNRQDVIREWLEPKVNEILKGV